MTLEKKGKHIVTAQTIYMCILRYVPPNVPIEQVSSKLRIV